MELDEIAGIGEAKAKSEEYRTALLRAVSSGDGAACRRFVDHGEPFVSLKVQGRRTDQQYTCCCAAAATATACPPPSLRCHAPARLLSFSAVLSDAVPLVLSRQLLLAFAQSLRQLQPEVQQEVAT